MSDRRRILILIGIMVFLCLAVGGIAILVLYSTSLDENRARLVETARSRARLIESVARYDVSYSQDYPGGPEAATISQVIEAHGNFEGFGRTGEFTLARREGDSIVFLLRHRHSDLIYPEPVALDSNLAEPMQQALAGLSGSLVGRDYRGETVLAAFEPVGVLDLGIVAKIDMAEIRAPFLRAGWIIVGVAAAAIALGILLFLRVSSPIVKRLERYTEALEAEITERNKTDQIKDEFIGMVSHELKTPLTVTVGALSVLMNQELPEHHVRELLEDAIGSADQMADIVENLLELSRSQAGRLDLEVRPTDVVGVAEIIARAFQGRSAIHRVTVDSSSGRAIVQADPIKVERILHNLVENAIKYSPEGGDVRVSAERRDDQVVVAVSDQGIGIAPEDQSRLFQSFERIGAYQTNNVAGIGLGLRVCRLLVEALGGRIWTESEPGKGSTFFFTLPGADGDSRTGG